jgi:hypothetical protein
MKKIIKFTFTKIFDLFYDKLFGKKRDVKNIWKPDNYQHYSKYFWTFVQEPLESRGIYLPLDFNNIIKFDQFKTFHNEHIVLEKYLKIIDSNIKNEDKFFIDIGAGDGVDMSNTLNLALNNYKGYMMESDDSKFAKLSVIYRDFPNVQLHKSKITPKNVVSLLRSFSLPQTIDVLNLDIDSYDYDVLKNILPEFNFKFLILEINPLFPLSIDFNVTYDENFEWESNHFNGASLSMFYKLLKIHKYSVIHLDRSFLLAVDSSYLNSEMVEKEINELDNLLMTTLKHNDPKKWERTYKAFWKYDDDEIIKNSKELFKNYQNYTINKSGLN